MFDNLHYLTFNPDRTPLREALAAALATWPTGVVPKIHFSTPRTEMKQMGSPAPRAARWTEHSDFVNPFSFVDFLHLAEGLGEFDIMLEAKRATCVAQTARGCARMRSNGRGASCSVWALRYVIQVAVAPQRCYTAFHHRAGSALFWQRKSLCSAPTPC